MFLALKGKRKRLKTHLGRVCISIPKVLLATPSINLFAIVYSSKDFVPYTKANLTSPLILLEQEMMLMRTQP